MKILLDECVTKKLKKLLSSFEVFTVAEMGWTGVKNGKLISLCVENNFNILITIDKNISYQQTINNYNITIVVFNSKTSLLSDLTMHLPEFLENIYKFERSKIYLIG